MMSLEQFKNICLPYDQATQVYTNPRDVQWAKWLNGFVINNVGTTWIYFNGGRILPGQSKTFGGNFAELYKGNLDFRFFTQSPPPATVVNQVEITQKFYIFPE